MDKWFTRGRWTRGRRVGNGLTFCLIGALDDAAAGFPREVATRVAEELTRDLPQPLRAIGARAPRATLLFYNDYVGRRRGTLRLLKTTLARLSTMQPFTAQAAVERQDPSWPSADRLASTAGTPPVEGVPHEGSDAWLEGR